MSKLSRIATSFAVVMAVTAPVTMAAVGGPNTAAHEIVAAEHIRPLTIHQSVKAEAAFGEDDEDCVLQTRRSINLDGTVKITRKLVCADADVD